MLDGTLRPNRKQKHNAKVRARIMAAAGEMFRKNGYDGTGIDALMAEAGLTRGAFYAHFMSKEALFVEVLSSDDPLVARLKARKGRDGDTLVDEMVAILQDTLAPENFHKAVASSNLVAFSADAGRGSDAMRVAYQDAFETMLAEMSRGQAMSTDAVWMHTMLGGVIYALNTARACSGADERAFVLRQGARMVEACAGRFKRRNAAEGLVEA